jgi:hypothetical protein
MPRGSAPARAGTQYGDGGGSHADPAAFGMVVPAAAADRTWYATRACCGADQPHAPGLWRSHSHGRRRRCPCWRGVDTFAWTVLSPDVLRVRRAGSVCGPTFDVKVVARLLDEPLGRVLERLQVRFVRGTSHSFTAECLEMLRVKGSPA